jgi:hypothetical protein
MNTLADVCCASIPVAALPHLAALRTQAGLRITLVGERAWLRWDAGHDEILRHLLPIKGAELFTLHEGLWYQPGRSLPVFDVPAVGESQPLARLVTPLLVRPEQSVATTFSPLPLRLVRDSMPRPASAVCCRLDVLAEWAELATTRQLKVLSAARCGERVLVIGRPLPPLHQGVRYWGTDILTPLGFGHEPALPEGQLREALSLQAEEIALIQPDGVEVLSRQALAPLTRAGIRLALQG